MESRHCGWCGLRWMERMGGYIGVSVWSVAGGGFPPERLPFIQEVVCGQHFLHRVLYIFSGEACDRGMRRVVQEVGDVLDEGFVVTFEVR